MTRAPREPLVMTAAGPGLPTGDDLEAQKGEEGLATQCMPHGTGGELPWRTDFGTPLHLLRHRGVTTTLLELARVWGRDALRRWLARTTVRFEIEGDGTEIWVRAERS